MSLIQASAWPDQLKYFRSAWRKCRENMTEEQLQDERERVQNGGFTNDEIEELVCQGISPDDPIAWDALDVIYDRWILIVETKEV